MSNSDTNQLGSSPRYGDRPNLERQHNRQWIQIQENRAVALSPLISDRLPNLPNGFARLTQINDGILNAIEAGNCFYFLSLFRADFDDVEAYLKSINYCFGSWSYLENWFDEFPLFSGIGDPSVELDGSQRITADLIFSWTL